MLKRRFHRDAPVPGRAGSILPALSRSVLPLLVVGACASTQTSVEMPDEAPRAHVVVETLADELVRDAERRVDTNTMRVYVDELREARDTDDDLARMRMDHGELASVGRELQRELVVALTSRLNLIDVELARRTAGLEEETPVDDVARAVGATHALVGTFSPRRDELEVLIRLVDAKSLVIVAAASGVLAVDDLSDLGRLALAPAEPMLDAPLTVVEIPRSASRRESPSAGAPAVRSAFREETLAEADPESNLSRTQEPTRQPAHNAPAESPADRVASGALPSETVEPAGSPAVTRQASPVLSEGAGRGPQRIEREPPNIPVPATPVEGPALRRLRAIGRSLERPGKAKDPK